MSRRSYYEVAKHLERIFLEIEKEKQNLIDYYPDSIFSRYWSEDYFVLYYTKRIDNLYVEADKLVVSLIKFRNL